MSCGPLILTLAEIPSDHPDNLFIALAHQLQQAYSDYGSPPNILIPQLRTLLKEFRQENPNYPLTLGGIIQSVCDCFNIKVTVFSNDNRTDMRPSNSSNIFFTAQLYIEPPNIGFDSICHIDVKAYHSLPNITSHVFFRMASWNIRGATDIIKRNMIDFELNEKKIWVCGIQESHLWSHNLSSANYFWILGKQSQSRASRGIGFLIHRRLSSLPLQTSFPSCNIGVLEIHFPSLLKPFYFVNVHKCSDGDINSSIENGIL